MNTKHNHQMIFGRKVEGCPRCEELKNGAEPRKGWQAKYFTNKKREDTQRLTMIKAHNFKICAEKNGCCTHFEW